VDSSDLKLDFELASDFALVIVLRTFVLAF
jgi:hypothetical protein